MQKAMIAVVTTPDASTVENCGGGTPSIPAATPSERAGRQLREYPASCRRPSCASWRGLLELPEPAHARALQSPACLQETRAARRRHLIVCLHEARHREIDPPER